jgi:hypothetical protein
MTLSAADSQFREIGICDDATPFAPCPLGRDPVSNLKTKTGKAWLLQWVSKPGAACQGYAYS